MQRVNFLSVTLLSWIAVIFTPTESATIQSDAVNFLKHYGYMETKNPRLGNLMSEDELMNSIKTFQRFAGITITGTLDKETIKKMSSKRCGNRDIVGTEATKRKKRFALQGSKWHKKHLTYKITEYTADLTKLEVDKQIKEAFKWWADVSGLSFEQVNANAKADIVILFGAGSHGDGDPFDGPGKTLAHAYFPVYGGDAHFDESETWTIHKSRNGAKLQIVAAHEFGHSLGLSHSDVNNALMAPFYNPDVRKLHSDDIRAIQLLYGNHVQKPEAYPTTPTRRPPTTRSTTTKPRRTTTTQGPPAGACNGRFDAITTMKNGSVYAFVGDEFWRLNNQGADDGFPQKIEQVWGIKGKVDAALTTGYYTDLFQRDRVYRYYKGKLQRFYPKQISRVYSGAPSDIDAAFRWSGNNKVYFMKGEQYWRYNTNLREVDNNYPKPLSVWKGLPEKIDAAMQWQSQTFFFSNGMYYRFDDERIDVAELMDRPYPRRTDKWWLGCEDKTFRDAVSQYRENNGENGSSSNLSGKNSFFVAVSLIVMGFINLSLS